MTEERFLHLSIQERKKLFNAFERAKDAFFAYHDKSHPGEPVEATKLEQFKQKWLEEQV